MANIKKLIGSALNKAKQTSTKKSLKKDPPDTPFQSYMKTKGATAADTSANTPYKAGKATANNPLLNKAYELTYGQDYKSSDVANPHGAFDSSRRGSHSGYSNVSNAARSAYEKEVDKMKKNK